MPTCETCGSDLVQSNKPSRPKTRFCSKECNWKAKNDARADLRRQKRVGRTCEICDLPIADSVAVTATTCSRLCSNRLQGKKAAARRKADRQAAMPPCEVCGGKIPDGTHAASRVCSKACSIERRRASWREVVSVRRRAHLFGVTPDRFAEMLAAQCNACAICGGSDPGGTGTWHVDHCHKTQHVRGLLCSECNLGLGLFKDDIEVMRSAIGYLERAGQAIA